VSSYEESSAYIYTHNKFTLTSPKLLIHLLSPSMSNLNPNPFLLLTSLTITHALHQPPVSLKPDHELRPMFPFTNHISTWNAAWETIERLERLQRLVFRLVTPTIKGMVSDWDRLSVEKLEGLMAPARRIRRERKRNGMEFILMVRFGGEVGGRVMEVREGDVWRELEEAGWKVVWEERFMHH
jgi:hypothetical protein